MRGLGLLVATCLIGVLVFGLLLVLWFALTAESSIWRVAAGTMGVAFVTIAFLISKSRARRARP